MPPPKVLINAVSARRGGAANYLRAVVPELHRRATAFEVWVCAPPEHEAALRRAAPGFRVFTPPAAALTSSTARLHFDQIALRRILRDERVDVLFSTANLGMLAAPCRQLLLVRNALFFNPLYLETLLPEKPLRARLGEWARRELTVASARAADTVLVPSRALADEMRAAGIGSERVEVVPYGVDAHRFATRAEDPPLASPPRLLFTSLWAEHKNLVTLLRALRYLRRGGLPTALSTTANPLAEPERSPAHARDRRMAAALVEEGSLTLLPEQSAAEIAARYAEADLFVYPSVVESFGHPLLEAMAAGLPVVAAEVPINRELCEDAALYFAPFDAAACAREISRVLRDAALRRALVRRGAARARAFSWSAHVDRLLLRFGG